MRWSQWYIPTLKEAPGDAEVISHKLLIRAGMIRKLTSGIYTWLPLGLRTLNKAANIVREEMDRAGRSGNPHADRAARRPVARIRALGTLRQGTPALQGPP